MEDQLIIETLHDAALAGELDRCKELIDGGVNVNAMNSNYLTRMDLILCDLTHQH